MRVQTLWLNKKKLQEQFTFISKAPHTRADEIKLLDILNLKQQTMRREKKKHMMKKQTNYKKKTYQNLQRFQIVIVAIHLGELDLITIFTMLNDNIKTNIAKWCLCEWIYILIP